MWGGETDNQTDRNREGHSERGSQTDKQRHRETEKTPLETETESLWVTTETGT